jgi:hypothetical protein
VLAFYIFSNGTDNFSNPQLILNLLSEITKLLPNIFGSSGCVLGLQADYFMGGKL